MCYPSTALLRPPAPSASMLDHDHMLGALLGTAVGDALGMPIDGLSHQNVRTYYKGIKGYRADEHRRDFDAGQWTGIAQRAFALVRALTATDGPDTLPDRYARELERLYPGARRWRNDTTVDAATAAAPLGVWWAAVEVTKEEAFDTITGVLRAANDHPAALTAGFGQAFAVRTALLHTLANLDGPTFFRAVAEMTDWAENQLGGPTPSPSDRLRLLADHLDDFPLDLQDLCDGTGAAADEAWPFAVAMVARNPLLLEATLLPAINVGGAASAIGALVGALVGALHGWAAFPADWRDGLEDRARLEAEADALIRSLA